MREVPQALQRTSTAPATANAGGKATRPQLHLKRLAIREDRQQKTQFSNEVPEHAPALHGAAVVAAIAGPVAVEFLRKADSLAMESADSRLQPITCCLAPSAPAGPSLAPRTPLCSSTVGTRTLRFAFLVLFRPRRLPGAAVPIAQRSDRRFLFASGYAGLETGAERHDATLLHSASEGHTTHQILFGQREP